MAKTQSFQDYVRSPNYRAQVESQVAWLKPLLGPTGLWLDIGAGMGLLLWEARRHRPHWDYRALEPDPAASQSLEGLARIEVDFESFWDGHEVAGSADVITLSHVLEHLREPKPALIRLRNELRPGGVLLVEVPNDPLHELLRVDRVSDLPHLWFFSRKGLMQLLEDSGFVILRSAVIGTRREAARRSLYQRSYGFLRRRVLGPQSLRFEQGWYDEGSDRTCLRVLAWKSPWLTPGDGAN